MENIALVNTAINLKANAFKLGPLKFYYWLRETKNFYHPGMDIKEYYIRVLRAAYINNRFGSRNPLI